MNVHLKKLTYKVYIVSAVILMAIVFGIWVLTNSFLSIKVSPRDASVFIDGEQIEVNSFGFAKERLSFGEHQIKIELDGYVSMIKSVILKRGRTNSQNITLKTLPATVKIANFGSFLTKGVNSDEFFYLGNDGGAIFRTKIQLNDSGIVIPTSNAITNSNLWGINEIIWSPKKDLALFRKSDGVYLFDFKKYDFVNQTETLWGENVGSIAWAPDDSKIAYYASDEKTLIFSNADNSSKERILNLENIDITNPVLRWSPDSEWLAIIPRNSNKNDNKIYLLNAYSRVIKPVINTGNKLDVTFSQNNKIFYSSLSRGTQGSSTISTINTDGTEDSALNLYTNINCILMLDQGDNILAASQDGESQEESIFKFNIKNNKQEDFSIKLSENESVNTLLTTVDDKVVIYETESGIYAVNIN
ncbi:MAG: PEGA domain-containing protein [Patescibacteria group bacterium]